MNIYSAIHVKFRYYIQAPTREAAAMVLFGHTHWAASMMVEHLTPDDETLEAARKLGAPRLPAIIRREPRFAVVRYCGRFDADTPWDQVDPTDSRDVCCRNVGHRCHGHEVILGADDVPHMSPGEREEQSRISPEHAACIAAALDAP